MSVAVGAGAAEQILHVDGGAGFAIEGVVNAECDPGEEFAGRIGALPAARDAAALKTIVAYISQQKA